MTSAEVVAELERTFTVRGHGLSGHFANGRVSFCGAGERQAIDRGLAELGSRQRLLDVVGWRGVVAMLGSAHMVAALDEQLLRKGLAASARKRLSAAREALVQRGAPP